MVSSKWPIITYEVTELIFKTFDKLVDPDTGEVEKSWGFFTNANKKQADFDKKEYEKHLKTQQDYINRYHDVYNEAFDGSNTNEAHAKAMESIKRADDVVLQHCDTLEDRGVNSAKEFGEAQEKAFNKAREGAAKFSPELKSMLSSIATELAVS